MSEQGKEHESEKVEVNEVSTPKVTAVPEQEEVAEVTATEKTTTAIPDETVSAEASAAADSEDVVALEKPVKENAAVAEMENKVAEDSEKDDEISEEEEIDFTTLTMEALVVELKKLVDTKPVQQLKKQVDAIKNAFNPKFGELLAAKKAAFLEAGGNTIDFKLSSPIKTTYNEILGEYKKKRDAYYSELESRLGANLEKREAVIETLKTLIEEAEPQTMYTRFKELQERWKVIGPVPKQHYNDTWKIYHHHVERFYDLLHLSNDFKDADFKNNLEQKLKVIERAEALAEHEDTNFAFKELQDLHKLWKEGIGPVSKEHREKIWQQFSEATKKIHDKRHEHYREMRSKFDEIIEKKLAIIAEIANYDTSKNASHNDWQKSIKDIEDLRKRYFDAGKLPYKKSEEVWQKFKNATKKFNKSKNNFYKQEKGGQQENLNKKIALIEVAEALKNSEDWETATNEFKRIQAEWKNIGHVPRKFSDDIWKRFKAACNHYFDRLHQNRNTLDKAQEAVVVAKKEFLETMKATEKATLKSVKEYISNWAALGVLPRNARHLEGKFNKQIDALLKDNNIAKEKVEMLKFTSVVDAYQEENNERKLESEQFFVRKKIDEATKEVQQLENNLSFFANSDSNNPLVKNVRDKINRLKEDLGVWQLKLNYLKKLN